MKSRSDTLVPLHAAADLAAAIDQMIEDGKVEPTEAINELLGTALTDVAKAVDRRRALATVVTYQAAMSRAEAARLVEHARRKEAVCEAVKSSTMALMEAHPKLPFRDSVGRKLSICNNSHASLALNGLSVGKDKNVSNIVDLVEAKRAGVDSRYLVSANFIVLDTEAIRADLEAGVELSWARLERGKHLRGLVEKPKDLVP